MRVVSKQILRLAGPAIINNITVPLLGLCDTAVSGHLGNARFIGAVAIGAMMINVVYWLFGFLRMGTSGLAATMYGARDLRGLRGVLNRSLLIAMIVGLVILAVHRPLGNIILEIVGAEPELRDLALQYYLISVAGVPAQLMLMAITGWFIGNQTTVVPMCISISINVLNIILTITLALYGPVGFTGIALATVIATWTGLIGAAIYIRIYLNKIKRFAWNGHRQVLWKDFFGVNSSLFVRSACIMGVSMAMTAFGARMSPEILAANAVMMQFFILLSYFMDGFAYSGEALIGKASGASDISLMRAIVRQLCLIGLLMALLFMLLYGFGNGWLAAFMTDDNVIRSTVMQYRCWLMILPPVAVWAFIFDGIFVGLTRTSAMMIATIVATAAFFALVVSVNDISNHILWLAFESYLGLRGLILALIYLRMQRRYQYPY